MPPGDNPAPTEMVPNRAFDQMIDGRDPKLRLDSDQTRVFLADLERNFDSGEFKALCAESPDVLVRMRTMLDLEEIRRQNENPFAAALVTNVVELPRGRRRGAVHATTGLAARHARHGRPRVKNVA